MEEARQGGPPGGGDIPAKPWVSSSWPGEAVREGQSPRVQRPPTPNGERCGVFKNQKGGYWAEAGKRGSCQAGLGRQREEMDTLRGQSSERACRRERTGAGGGSEGSGWCPELWERRRHGFGHES